VLSRYLEPNTLQLRAHGTIVALPGRPVKKSTLQREPREQMLLEQVRADPTFGSIPFVLGSAESNLVAAKHAGADGYLVKPFSGEMLKAKKLVF
jgi:hypothetical protein